MERERFYNKIMFSKNSIIIRHDINTVVQDLSKAIYLVKQLNHNLLKETQM